MTDTPKPAPATPAATPMDATLTDEQRKLIGGWWNRIASAAHHADLQNQEQWKAIEAIAYALFRYLPSVEAALQPAAAQPQRESEPPEQALREAVQDMMPLIELYAEREINSPATHQEFARQTEQKLGRLRAVLSPQTDSQEPR